MSIVLFGDGDNGLGVPVAEWVKTAGLVVSLICIPLLTIFVGLYFRKRDRDAQDRKQEYELTEDERRQARKDKSEDEKNLDKQRDKLYARMEKIEAECRRENEELRDWITALYGHIMSERAVVGRWMGKVISWVEYAVEDAKRDGRELRPIEPPPELPDPPVRPDRLTEDEG